MIALGDLTKEIDYINKKQDYDVKVESREDSHNDESIVELVSNLKTGYALLVKSSDITHRIQKVTFENQVSTLVINFTPIDHMNPEANISD